MKTVFCANLRHCALQLNAAAYFYDYGAYQIGGLNIGTILAPNIVKLSSPAQVFGVELETVWRPTSADVVSFNAAYTNAEFTDSPTEFTTYVANSRMPNVPDWTAQGTYSHRFELGGDQSLTFGITGRYRSSVQLNTIKPSETPYLPFIISDSQIVGDANVTWAFNDRVSLIGYVRNFTDERFKSEAAVIGVDPFGNVLSLARRSDPRVFGAVLNVQF